MNEDLKNNNPNSYESRLAKVEARLEESENEAQRAGNKVYLNRLHAEKHNGVDPLTWTPPSPEHYPHRYLWDSAFIAIMYSRTAVDYFNSGKIAEATEFARYAEEECFALFIGQHASGMIPNVHFAPDGRIKDPERILAFDKNAEGSNYSQPPILAEAIFETYKALDLIRSDRESTHFLETVYSPLKKSLDYWTNKRSNNYDPADPNAKGTNLLVAVIHPHETGRDSDPLYNYLKPMRFRRKGEATSHFVDKANAVLDYGQILLHGVNIKDDADNTEKLRKHFWANDVMVNTIYANNLAIMGKLGGYLWKSEDQQHYEKLSTRVEQQILESMWSEDKQEFVSLDGTGKEKGEDFSEINHGSVGNLFGLTLPNISAKQLSATLELIARSYNTNYPLASVPTDSPEFDPHNQQPHRLWQGPVWINVNWCIVQGLTYQAGRTDLPPDLRNRSRTMAIWIAEKSKELVDKHGAYEHYNPISGDPQRLKVHNFAWSYLAYFMNDKNLSSITRN